MKVTKESILKYNQVLRRKTPHEIVSWAIKVAERPVLTTNFGPRSASLIHLISQTDNNIPVIWCDTGYNTSFTYRYAMGISDNFKLNLYTYVPSQTAAQREILLGGIPTIDDPNHKIFTEQVKLEPFRRAMKEHQPDVWFTNIRKGQTAFRDTLDILSLSSNGVIKVSPFYYWSDDSIDNYLEENDLPNETKYFDPTKVLQNRECGLHL